MSCTNSMYRLPNQPIFETLPVIVKAKPIRQNTLKMNITSGKCMEEQEGIDYHKSEQQRSTTKTER